MSEILKDLNDEQKRAVECESGPMLIVAGAGSGKTRVLTSRIAYLIENGVLPERILALTFTKKAAGEMKDRIGLMVGERKARRIWMGTFHSVFIRFLRDYADKIGFMPDFTIYDTSDSISAIKTCMSQIENDTNGRIKIDPKDYKPKDVLAQISRAKNALVTPTHYERGEGGFRALDAKRKKDNIYLVYKYYCEYCHRSNVMDFDDILLYTNILFRDTKEALQEIASRFDHVLVDEYQDTNYAQYLIIKKLSWGHKNICVVGDDSQSIYGFRGAQIQNILNFRDDFPGTVLFRLQCNYRSTQNIVNAANTLIARNENRIPKECVSMGDKGELIHLVHSYSGDNEAELISYSILDRIRENKCEYQDFAILYRTNSQSRVLEEKLRNRNIPYTLYGTSFFDRQEVKDVLAYLKLLVNPSDGESFKRIINKPTRGIGDTSIAALEKASQANGCSLYDAAYLNGLEVFGLRNAAIIKIRAFCDMIRKYSSQTHTVSAVDLAEGIIKESGLYAFYNTDDSRNGDSDRIKNVEEELSDIASKQDRYIAERLSENPEGDQPIYYLTDYLEEMALLSTVDNEEKTGRMENVSNNTVKLMTIHTAKGLEFTNVYIAGLEENIFPSKGRDGIMDLEEERRLFYVAMTRAKKALTISYASQRYRNGKTEFNSPSRFLREIAPQYLDHPLTREDMEAGRRDDDDDFGSVGVSWRRGSFGERRPVTVYGSRPASKPSSTPVRPSATPSARPSVTPGQDRASMVKPPVIDANFVPDPMTSFKAGDSIEHNRFGKGKILEILGQVPDLKARVHFDQYGDKLLILKFAKMRHC
jgi:DNA helicase-2/ATP-dependent DNA helicase PcrA